MNTSEIINEFSYGYEQQASAPEWFDRENPLHFSATSGSSFLNEWYGFDSKEQAFKMLCDYGVNSDRFNEKYVDLDGKFYSSEHDVDWIEDEESCEMIPTLKPDAEPVSFQEIVDCLSNF